jgi:hypothetical protein
LWGWRVDETGSGICRAVGFVINFIELLSSVASLLVDYSFYTFPIPEYNLEYIRIVSLCNLYCLYASCKEWSRYGMSVSSESSFGSTVLLPFCATDLFVVDYV